jgi:hypothetical protein
LPEKKRVRSPSRIQVTARHRNDSFRVDVAADDGIIDGTVELNGALFATVSGPKDDPTFLRASGDPLMGSSSWCFGE